MSKKNLLNKIYNAQYSCCTKIDGPFGKRFITYADYIASGQPLKFIENYIEDNILPTYANTHTESSFTGKQTSHFREEARSIIKKSCNANENDALIFTGSGSTGAIDLLIRKLAQFYSNEKVQPIVFLGPYEHHSNILPWRESSFDVIEIPLCNKGAIDLEILEKHLIDLKGKRPIIGSFSAASNVTGIKSRIKKITQILKAHGALVFWDFAGAAPYVKIDMNAKDAAIDAVFISPHKMIGGPGSPGILIAKKTLMSGGLPVVVGGGTVKFVNKSLQLYNDQIEVREEGGTPPIIESIRAALAFKLKDEVGVKTIKKIEHKYTLMAFDQLSKNPNIKILGSRSVPRLCFFAFQIRHENKYLHHNFVVALLNDLFGIQGRGGCSCAGPYGHDLLELDGELSKKHIDELSCGNIGSVPGWVRLNFNYFIPKDEFNYVIKSVNWVANHGWKLLKMYFFDDKNALWYVKNDKNTKLKSLNSFLGKADLPKKGKLVNKEKERKKYFKVADLIAEEAVQKWNNVLPQKYSHSQVENPIRWYLLSDDLAEMNS